MPENLKTRIAKIKKQIAIPREIYLAAVKRQEHRVWAYRADPRLPKKLRILIGNAKNQFLISEGKDPEPLPDPEQVKEPDPAVFDTEDQIRHDDAIIEAYISDNPGERRRSNARGHTHAELLKYWHSVPEGEKCREEFSREMMPKIIEIRDHVLAEGCRFRHGYRQRQ